MIDKQVEVEAKNALAVIAQAIDANPGTGQAVRLVKFIAGVYNGYDYPFALAELRGLDKRLANACLTYLNYDVLGIKEVHNILPDGAKRLNDWFVEYGLRPKDHSVSDLGHGDDEKGVMVSAKLVTYGSAPGYRDSSFTLDLTESQSTNTIRVDMQVSAADGLTIKSHIEDVHRSAWRSARGPIDKKDGEQRPGWLDAIGDSRTERRQ